MKTRAAMSEVDYSYRIHQVRQYTKSRRRIKDGVVETEQADSHAADRLVLQSAT